MKNEIQTQYRRIFYEPYSTRNKYAIEAYTFWFRYNDEGRTMKNKDLIAILSKQDPEAEVRLEYDTLCCVYRDFTIVKVDDPNPDSDTWYNDTGIYLMCEDADMAKYLWEERRKVPYEILHRGMDD